MLIFIVLSYCVLFSVRILKPFNNVSFYHLERQLRDKFAVKGDRIAFAFSFYSVQKARRALVNRFECADNAVGYVVVNRQPDKIVVEKRAFFKLYVVAVEIYDAVGE